MTASPTRAAPLLSVRGVGVAHEVGDHHDDGSDSDRAYAPPRPVDVSFEVAPGEAVLLLGPSGCGKSTLTLTLDGLVPQVVTSRMTGQVVVDGRDTTEHRVPVLATSVGMVFQDPDAQVVTATVLDEVCFGPENLRLDVPDVLARAEAALRRVGLWERRHDDPAHLSGGGRQRLAIACALALDPPVLVLDEPTANLDPAGVEEVYARLRALLADRTRAVVLVEHDVDAAVTLVDRVVVLDADGRQVADGPVRAVLTDPASVDRLEALGVHLPVAVTVARRLARAGVPLPGVPLTVPELTTALDAVPALPEPALPEPVVPGPGARPVPPGPAGEPVVEVRGLTLARGRGRRRVPVLQDVALSVGRGELVAVVGPNGAGKTTLAQAVAGVLRPPAGTVRTGAVDPGTASPRELARHVGFVFQNPEHQLVATRVDDELAVGPRLLGLPEEEVAARVEDLLERLGLTALRAVHPFLLSGGQKRRLSVGTVLGTAPGVVVLDEPTYGQDRQRAAELLALLDAVRADGTAVLAVTHDLQLVAEHATRVVVVVGGRVVGGGDPAAVLADPALLTAASLRVPPLARATAALTRHPAWHGVTRLAQVPGGPA